MNLSLLNMFVSGEGFQELCDVWCGLEEDFQRNPRIASQPDKQIRLDTLSEPFHNPYRVFCYSHRLRILESKLSLFQNPFMLLSHNEDENIDEGYRSLADHPRIEVWFAQNLCFRHPKVHLLPIGIANAMWPHGNQSVLKEVQSQNLPKTKDFFFYFDVRTNPPIRGQAYRQLVQKGFSPQPRRPYREYLMELAQHRWVFCPEGHGIDCHRVWEAAALGVIPILVRSPHTTLIAERIPCVLIPSWLEFNPTSLTIETPSHPISLSLSDWTKVLFPLTVVYSYVGPLPAYARASLHQLRLFYDGPTIWIGETPPPSSYGVEFVPYPTVRDCEWEEFARRNGLSLSDRDVRLSRSNSLWRPFLFYRAFERFYLLRNLMKQRGLRNVLFVEVDNLLYVDPHNFLPLFEKRGLGYMNDHIGRNSAGVFWARSVEALESLLEGFETYISQIHAGDKSGFCARVRRNVEARLKHPTLSEVERKRLTQILGDTGCIQEMSALWDYAETHPEQVQIFPSHWTDPTYEGILFDPAPYGVCLYGMDLYHTGGMLKTGVPWISSRLPTTEYTYSSTVDEKGRKLPRVHENIPFFNLHISSKVMEPALSKPLP